MRAAEIAMRRPAGAARGIYATFAASAAAIALPIGTSEGLAGRRLIGHVSDVGLQLFPAFCAAQGLDPAATRLIPAEGAMVAFWDRVRAGEADGLFAYVSTLTAALAAAGEITWLRYDEGAPDLQGTIAREMAHPDRFALGLGDADPARIVARIDLMTTALHLPRRPQPAEVFTAALLPPRPARPWPVPVPC